MADKIDVDVDVAALGSVEAAVLAGLRVGQRLRLASQETEATPLLCTEEGVSLAPLPPVATRSANPKVIIRAIKREAGSGVIQRLQVRVYPSDGAEPTAVAGGCAANAGPGSGTPAGLAPATAETAPGGNEENEYKLRRSQYQALADSAELRDMLADPRLQAVLSKIDSAADREKALSAQLEAPEFQGFVSQMLGTLDPDRVPATAATAAAVAMATKQ